MNELNGGYITVNYLNQYFENEARMFIEHYDKEDYKDTVFVLGTNVFSSISSLEESHKNKKIIIWQAEQLFVEENPTYPSFHNPYNISERLKGIDKSRGHEIWDVDYMNAAFLAAEGVSVDKVAPVKFTESLRELNTLRGQEEIDVLFCGNVNARRANVFNTLCYELFYENVNMVFNFNMNLQTQKKYIEKSKIILNIHHTSQYNRQEQPRIFYPLINKKCVLSETSQHNYFGEAIVESDISNMRNAILSLIQDDNYIKQGERGFEIFKQRGAIY